MRSSKGELSEKEKSGGKTVFVHVPPQEGGEDTTPEL